MPRLYKLQVFENAQYRSILWQQGISPAAGIGLGQSDTGVTGQGGQVTIQLPK